MDDNSPQKLSTSALAKAVEVPSQQLFSTLKDYGWIRKLEEGWALTRKGEFEGGEYVHSKRYGRYIVWPPELVEHPLLQALEDNRHTSATALGKPLGLNAREVNRILAELGWIRHGMQGWELTALGEQCDGVQLENESSGTFYVVWPQSIASHTELTAQLNVASQLFSPQHNSLQNNGASSAAAPHSSDLFTELPVSARGDFPSIDGHRHASRAKLQICYWLYMAGLAHACDRRLPAGDGSGSETLVADFYLPAHHLYIDVWEDQTGDVSLAQKLQRKEMYQTLSLAVIDIEQDDLQHLDEVLTRHLRKHGIRVY